MQLKKGYYQGMIQRITKKLSIWLKILFFSSLTLLKFRALLDTKWIQLGKACRNKTDLFHRDKGRDTLRTNITEMDTRTKKLNMITMITIGQMKELMTWWMRITQLCHFIHNIWLSRSSKTLSQVIGEDRKDKSIP